MRRTDIQRHYKPITFYAFLNWVKHAIKTIMPDGNVLYDIRDVKKFEENFFKGKPENFTERIIKENKNE